MNNWIIKKTSPEAINENFNEHIDLNSGFRLSFTLNQTDYFFNKNTRSGIFLFGYYTYRLNQSERIKDLNSLYEALEGNIEVLPKIIKGIFTIILISNGNFTLINDPLGISKFFYSKDLSCFAGRIKPVKEQVSDALSQNNLLEYYVFNYCLNGHTFFQNINYSIAASCFKLIPNGQIVTNTYFDIIKYLSEPMPKISSKEVFGKVSEQWLKIIKQWQNELNGQKASLTLTAGVDSRIILGSFLKSGYKPFDTFTFGHELSSDVRFAKLLADKYCIPHNHVYPETEFFEGFDQKAKSVFNEGDTLVSLYRAHRQDAYSQLKGSTRAIFMGMAGSDLVRGFGYNGLITSPLAYHCLNKKEFNKYFQDQQIIEKLNAIGFQSTDSLLDNEATYDYVKHPLHYLFKVIIPLHFSQDVLINSNMGINTYLPFLDFDYLDILLQTNYFGHVDYNNYKLLDIKRRARGLYYSARLAKTVHPELANFSLGKGYSPDDIVKSRILTLIKGSLYKFSKEKRSDVANFSYGTWFWEFLTNYFQSNDIGETTLNKEYLFKQLLNTAKSGGELHFLDFVKAVNVHMATKL